MWSSLSILYREPPPTPQVSALGTTAPPLSLVDSPPMSAPSQVSQILSLPLDPSENHSQNISASRVSEVPNNIKSHTQNMVTKSMNNIYKLKKLFPVTKHPIPPSLESTTVNQALSDPRWRDVMSSELMALMCHDT